ncbi:MAG TPA: epoxide hydrolase [Thermomicrobiales bacterium]|nr:epoxide hydrolase [Thermomicrobiales bacterium]
MQTQSSRSSAVTLAPYRVAVPQAAIDDLLRRVASTRWPHAVPAPADRESGTAPDFLQRLAGHWLDRWDWRAEEAGLNAWPQLIATVEGTPIHVIHVRSPEPDAMPLILTHGWPGTGFDFTSVIGPLSDPRAHGLDPAQAFHLVIPTIPGFGFSGPLEGHGWDAVRVARAWIAVMDAFGYERFGVHGGDWGTPVSLAIGQLAPDRVIGVHLSYLGTRAPLDDPTLNQVDRDRLGRTADYVSNPAGYWVLQSTRPLTLAYALADSPVGQFAWIADRIQAWMDPSSALDQDRLLTTASIFWLANTADSSSRLHFTTAGVRGGPQPCPVPVGVAVSPHDIILPSRTVAERTYDVVHWTEFPRGGHFPAIEVPDLLSGDLRAFFGQLGS